MASIDVVQLADEVRLAGASQPAQAGWPMSPAHRLLIATLIERVTPASVLEFGAGLSSVAVAEALATIGGGRLTSIEQDPEWCRSAWSAVEQLPEVDSRLVRAKIVPRLTMVGLSYFMGIDCSVIEDRGPFEVVIVDGPQGCYGREGCLHWARDMLAKECWVIVDDAGRIGERRVIQRWLRVYSMLRVELLDPEFAGRGIAVLRASGSLRPRVSGAAFCESVWEFGRRYVARRRKRREGSKRERSRLNL